VETQDKGAGFIHISELYCIYGKKFHKNPKYTHTSTKTICTLINIIIIDNAKLLLGSLLIFFFTKRHPWLPKGHTTLFKLVILPLAPLASYLLLLSLLLN
jgi:hypothetical protein